MKREFKEEALIKCYETDKNMSLKPYSFMNMAQEMANIHASMIGFGYDNLVNNNLAWVLSRFKAKYHNATKWRDEISRETWHKGSEGLFSIRDFEIRKKSGELLISATSYWVIINMETRRIQRTDHIEGFEDSESRNPKNADVDKPDKIETPDNLLRQATRTVMVSDLDMNGHTNNAKYIEWAMDAIDPEAVLNREIDEFQVNFNVESMLHDHVEIYTGILSDNLYYVEGRKEEKSIFQSLIKFK